MPDNANRLSKVPLSYSDIDIFVLAGGQGRRVRHLLNGMPKVLAVVGNKLMLECLLDWIYDIGGRHVVLGLGVGHEHVVKYFEEHPCSYLRIDLSIEKEPLGTAGAVRHARHLLGSDPVLIVNGDTLIDVDMLTFFKHQQRFRTTMLVANGAGTSAGACLMNRETFDRLIADEEISLEKFLSKEHLIRFRCQQFHDIGTPGGWRGPRE